MCAARNPAGMIVSDSCRPITSSRDQPNVAAACAFHAHDAAVRVHADERVVRRVEHQPRARLALGEVLHGLPAIGIGERDHDEVGERQREVLLVELPGPRRRRRARCTSRPSGAILLPQRHVEHRADAVRRQVALAELARARIAVRVGRGDDAIVADGAEIGRHVALVQPFA